MASTPRCAALTLFAGRPLPGAALTSWDAECGFSADQDVVGIRRDEDRQALDMLGARAIWLNFRDDQYGEPRREDALVRALAGVIDDVVPHAIYFPLGLFHRDHRRSSDAALALWRRSAGTPTKMRSIDASTNWRASGAARSAHPGSPSNVSHSRARDMLPC